MANLKTIKTVKNGVLYHDAQGNPLIRVDNVRFSYPYVGTPSEEENDDGKKVKKWRCSGLLPKATHKAVRDLIEGEIKKLNAANEAKVPADKWFLTDGDEKEDETAQGHWVISASDGKIRPKARDRKGQVIDDIEKIDEIFYGGMWGHMLIRPWFFDGNVKGATKKYPKRVSAGLNAVVFYKDDKPFGTGRVDDEDAWDDLPDADDDSDDEDDDI